MPFAPESYSVAEPYDLLAAAAKGHLAFDRRLARALAANPERTLPGLIRFANEDRRADRVDLSLEVLALFVAMPPVPEAVKVLIAELRKSPQDAPLNAMALAAKLGPAAIDPMLDLYEETRAEGTESLFVALVAGASGPRVEKEIEAIQASDPEEAAFLRDVATGKYEAVSGDELWEDIPEEAPPYLSELPDAERAEFLNSESAYLRRLGAASYIGSELSDQLRQRMLRIGKSDSDPAVRGFAWESLRDYSNLKPIRQAMAERLAATTDPVERASLACALVYQASETPGVAEAIEAAYNRRETLAKALEAMWLSMDRRWIDRPPLHLADPDVEVRRHAILGVGYFRLEEDAPRLEALFEDPELREDAIFAYALSSPAEETGVGLRLLEKRVVELAGGLSEEEETVLADAIDTRLLMSGRTSGDDSHAAPEPSRAKPGRNDPCPCGSGKKFKKCCG